MNKNIVTILTLVIMCLFLIVQTGCEYDVAEPQWDKPYTEPAEPEITGIIPADHAPAGVNQITITGNNFASVQENNKVYFNATPADIIDFSPTSITVLRPNVVSDSAFVKLVSYDALVVAKRGPYKIDKVVENFGRFLDKLMLSAIGVDANENVWVAETGTHDITKISPNGDRTLISTNEKVVTDIKFLQDGSLILLQDHRDVAVMNPSAGEITVWKSVGKRVKFGDFDANGNFYAGGRRSGVVVARNDDTVEALDLFARDEILGLRVFNNYVYTYVDIGSPDEQTPDFSIWRIPILDAAGTLGTQEVVWEWNKIDAAKDSAESLLNTFAISDEGDLLFGSDHTQSLDMLYTDGHWEEFYKGIVATPSAIVVWGNNQYAYMVQGAPEWTIFRIDMGRPGAPYYRP
ncbi:IPT/TIG domain-containing protein [candidate division KSB1 bacterium]|nr:IPT/TIG domain-containing protein [candidate division KSB1 bacterium]